MHIFGFNCILVLAVFSHLRAMLTDPGIVPITIESECKNKQNKKFRDDLEDDSFTDSDDDNLTKKLQYVVRIIFCLNFFSG